jgi:hypothetical protein
MTAPLERSPHGTNQERIATESTSIHQPYRLSDYVETALNTNEKRDAILGKIHKTAADGVILLKALHTETFTNMDDFFAAYNISNPSPNERQLFGEIIDEWNKRTENADRFFRKLEQQQKNPATGEAKRIEDIVVESRGLKAPKGSIRIERKGAYIAIYCESMEDYTSLYYGKDDANNSPQDGGTYHGKMTFSVVDTHQVLPEWVDRTKPPPRRKKEVFEVPVLLIRSTAHQSDEEMKVFIHEQQHLINQAFAKLYGSTETLTGTPLERLQDEIIAGVREGETDTQLVSRLRTGGGYDSFILGDQETNIQREKILKEVAEALSEPNAKRFFSTEETRALLAFHLMYAKPQLISRRIKTITRYLEGKLLSEPISSQEGPIDIYQLPTTVPDEVRAKLTAKEAETKRKYLSYLDTMKQFVLRPSEYKEALETRKREYLTARRSLVQDLSIHLPGEIFGVMSELDNRFLRHGPPPRRKRS